MLKVKCRPNAAGCFKFSCILSLLCLYKYVTYVTIIKCSFVRSFDMKKKNNDNNQMQNLSVREKSRLA